MAARRSWDFRSLTAEIIFMAFVTCWVFFTERMRRRMSWRPAMGLGSGGGAQGGEEALLEGRDLGLEGGLGVVGELLALTDAAQRLGGVHAQVVQHLDLEAAHLARGDVVHETVGGHPDRGDLLFHRHGLVLALLED